MTATCKHGHERTPENTYTRPNGRANCRPCMNATTERWRRRAGVQEADWLQKAVLAQLRAHPEGLSTRDLRRRLGYRSDVRTVSSTLTLLRVKGHPIARVRTRHVLRPLEIAS